MTKKHTQQFAYLKHEITNPKCLMRRGGTGLTSITEGERERERIERQAVGASFSCLHPFLKCW